MIRQLISIRLRTLLGATAGKNKDGSPKSLAVWKIVLIALLFIYIAASFIMLFSFLSIGMAMTMLPAGQDSMYLGMFTLIGFSLVFIFSIFETKSELFECKDNELLLSLPIKPTHIIISRIFTILILNYAEMSVVLIPAIVVYAIFGGSPLGIVGGVIVFLLLPLLATALSSAVGYVVSVVAARLKRKALVTTVLSFLFLFAYMYFYIAFMGDLGEETEDTLAITIPNIPFISALGRPALMEPAPLLIFVLAALGISYLAYHIISTRYFSIVSSGSSTVSIKYKARSLRRSSALTALTGKELALFFGTPTYTLNAGIGAIMSIVLGVMAIIYSSDLYELVEVLEVSWGMLSHLLVAALVFCSGTIMISASALSLEGKSFWITRSMPIGERTLLLSKLLAHLVIAVPPTLVASILMMIAGKATITEIPFYILTPIAANVLFALFGLVMNVCFPKLEYINESQVVKSSLSVFLTMAFGMLYSFGVGIVGVFFSLMGLPAIGHILILLVSVAVSVVLAIILRGPCAARCRSLNA